jgi:hypothetical protein
MMPAAIAAPSPRRASAGVSAAIAAGSATAAAISAMVRLLIFMVTSVSPGRTLARGDAPPPDGSGRFPDFL